MFNKGQATVQTEIVKLVSPKSSPRISHGDLQQETLVQSLKVPSVLRLCEMKELLLTHEIKYISQRNVIITVTTHKFH